MKSKLTLSVSSQAVRNESEPEPIQGIDARLENCFGAYHLSPGKHIEDIRLQSLLQKHRGAK